VGNTKSISRPVIGFLTVVEHAQHGLFGGYLILNLAGRPVEFHCTAPIKPNRAQQILYGPTLDSFLYGEQIGATLLGHAKSTPLAICTDREPVLSLGELTDLPVALVVPPDALPGGEPTGGEEGDSRLSAATTSPASGYPAGPKIGTVPVRLDAAHPRSPRLLTFALGRNRLAIAPSSEAEQKRFREQMADAADSLDLWEPFTRIREAIEEAQQAAR
jgi:hypothetical protein